MHRALWMLPLAAAAACASRPPLGPQPATLDRPPLPVTCLTPSAADTVWPSDSLDLPLKAVAWYFPAPPLDSMPAWQAQAARFSFRVQPSGRVDPCSLERLEPASPPFERYARTWILNTIYSPPRRRGAPVYALMEQRVSLRFGR